MNYKTHINGGIFLGLYMTCSMPHISLFSKGIFIGSSIVGSLLPDIDHTNSYIGKKAKPVSKAINKLAGHRKLFHSPFLYLILYSISMSAYTDNTQLMMIKGVFYGILSHLLLDSFTAGGLPWFYPLSKKKFSITKIKTNSKSEDIINVILTIINVIVVLDIMHITSIFTFTQNL